MYTHIVNLLLHSHVFIVCHRRYDGPLILLSDPLNPFNVSLRI